MNTNSSNDLESLDADQYLQRFMERAIALGIHSIEAFAELIPDPALRKVLIEAANVNPYQGERGSAARRGHDSIE